MNALGGQHLRNPVAPVAVYLDNDLLFNAVRTVDSLDNMVRATVLDDGISHFDFPFEHAHNELSIEKEFSTAV